MIAWFRRKRPTTPAAPAPSRGDIITAHAWGLNLDEWFALTDFERAECRRNITTAPRFEVAA